MIVMYVPEHMSFHSWSLISMYTCSWIMLYLHPAIHFQLEEIIESTLSRVLNVPYANAADSLTLQ